MDVSLLIVAVDVDFPESVREHLDPACPTWSVYHANDLSVARTAIDDRPFAAAIVDAEFGEAEVRQFLSTLRAEQPDCLRLVMADPDTLEADTDLVTTCHRVLVSPCDPFALRMAVEHARRLRDTLGSSGVRALGLRRRSRDSRRPTGDLLSTV